MKKIKALLKNLRDIFNQNRYLFYYLIGCALNGYFLRIITFKQYFSVVAFLGDIFISLIFCIPYLFLSKKYKNTYILALVIVAGITCFCNAIYYNYYNSFVSITFLSLIFVNYDTGGTNVTKNIINVPMFFTLVFPLLMIYLYIKKYKKETYESTPIGKKVFALSITLVLLLMVLLLKPVDYSRLHTQWNREYLVSRFGIYIYQFNDIIKSIEPSISPLLGSDQAYLSFKEYYKDKEGPKKNEYTDKYLGKNIIVIHYESMQQVAMNTKFNGKEVTPVLNKLAKEGIYFNNFYSQVSAGTSSDSEFTFSTSLMPVNSGTVFIYHADKTYVSTPKLLKEKGYYAFSMHANNGVFWNRKVMHKNLGYDVLYDRSTYVIDETIGFGLTDKSFYKQSVPIIKEISTEKSPFYATIITLSNHTPFSETDKFGEFKTTKTVNGKEYPYMEDTKLGNYFKSAHYADEQLGLFINLLDKNGLLDNTVLVIYGDHDARIPNSEYNRFINYDYETDSTYDEDDPRYQELDYYWFEMNRKVPLVIWTKDKKEATVVDKPMGMYDVMPTLGNMFGFYNPYALGNDIFSIEDNIVVFPNGNWLTNSIYYNAGKSEYKLLKDSVLTDSYIDDRNEYTKKLLTTSNDIIIYDLIKRDIMKEKGYVKE